MLGRSQHGQDSKVKMRKDVQALPFLLWPLWVVMVVVKEGTMVIEAVEVGTAHQRELCNGSSSR